MKINLEIKPKEWLSLAVFILLMILLMQGHTQQAYELVQKILDYINK